MSLGSTLASITSCPKPVNIPILPEFPNVELEAVENFDLSAAPFLRPISNTKIEINTYSSNGDKLTKPKTSVYGIAFI